MGRGDIPGGSGRRRGSSGAATRGTARPGPRRAALGAATALGALAAAVGCARKPEAAQGDVGAIAATEAEDRRLLLVGWDGATWAVIDPLLEAGRMPNLARLLAHGTRAPLATLTPTLSPAIWTTIATGVTPEVHGITDFLVPAPAGGRRLVTGASRRVDALWNIASRAGLRVGVVGWWASYPAEEVNGFVVSDHAAAVRARGVLPGLGLEVPVPPASDGLVFPPALAGELADVLQGGWQGRPDDLDRFFELPAAAADRLAGQEVMDPDNPLSWFRFTYLVDRVHAEAMERAVGAYDPQLAMVYFDGIDIASHCFWKYHDPGSFRDVRPEDVRRFGGVVSGYYVYMDEVLGRLVSLFPAGRLTVMIVSDHGHEPNPRHRPDAPNRFDRVSSGYHERAPDGVLVLAGAGVRPGAAFETKPWVLDVAPTALALLGLPVGAELPGRVLAEAILPDRLASRAPAAVPSRTAPRRDAGGAAPESPAERALYERLRAIGYVE